jgi:hypothetical protein
MIIYLASPYSNPDEKVREENYRIVSQKAAELVAEGKAVISPITYGHTLLSFKEMPGDWEFWKNFCIEILDKCDELYVYQMKGWEESKGVKEEIEFAKNKKIKITYIN